MVIYHLVWVKDSIMEGPSLHSILVVNEFPDVFLYDHPGVLRIGKWSLVLICFEHLSNIYSSL